jgi:hypothetical protein
MLKFEFSLINELGIHVLFQFFSDILAEKGSRIIVLPFIATHIGLDNLAATDLLQVFLIRMSVFLLLIVLLNLQDFSERLNFFILINFLPFLVLIFFLSIGILRLQNLLLLIQRY